MVALFIKARGHPSTLFEPNFLVRLFWSLFWEIIDKYKYDEINYLLKFLNFKMNILGWVAYKQYTNNRYFHPPFWKIASKKESHLDRADSGQNGTCRQLMYSKNIVAWLDFGKKQDL